MHLQEPTIPCNLTSQNVPNSMHQGHLLLEGTCTKHILTLTCPNTPSPSNILANDTSPSTGAPKHKPKKLVDLDIVMLQQQEDDLKLALYKELHRYIQTEKIDIPIDLAHKLKLPPKQIQAVYQGNLQALNLFQLMFANTQFGYNMIICMRANKDYLPGSISLET